MRKPLIVLLLLVLTLIFAACSEEAVAYAYETDGPVYDINEDAVFTTFTRFALHYEEQDALVAIEIFEILEANYERITSILGVHPVSTVNVHIYPDLPAFHYAIRQPNSPDWVVGVMWNGAIHMVSPSNPGPVHDFDTVIQVALHEFVHVVAHQLNSRMLFPFLQEGLATYLAGQSQFVEDTMRNLYAASAVPGITTILNIVWHDNIYEIGYAFVEFIVLTFGYDAMVAFYANPNIYDVFGLSRDELNEKWFNYVANRYGS